MAVSLTESPIKEDLLYVGTDDGIIQISENAGKNWTKISRFKTVPEYTYVSDILASKHDENVVFASFDNRKRDDFTPYILKSIDKGKTWKSISNNLPKNGTVHTIEQDYLNPDLLFVGTEFGVFFSNNGGEKWTQLKSGIPTIAIRDMVIHKRENDLILASFGRGFFILDDYSPLRIKETSLKEKKAYIFPIKDALLYIEKQRGGYGYGSMPYKAKNPPYGATFTYFLKEVPKTKQAIRRENEKKLFKEKSPIRIPNPKELYDEKNEFPAYLLFTISDDKGSEIKQLTAKAQKGINRITWNLRSTWARPIMPKDKYNPLKNNNSGLLVLPGTYFIKMELVTNGLTKELVANQKFKVKRLNNTTLPANDFNELAMHFENIKELARVTWGVQSTLDELTKKVNSLEQISLQTANLPKDIKVRLHSLHKNLQQIKWKLYGENPKASYEEIQPAPMSVFARVNSIIYIHNQSTSALSKQEKENYQIVKKQLEPIITKLDQINKFITLIEKELDYKKAGWTSGRLIRFRK
jgi:hypothetical protein